MKYESNLNDVMSFKLEGIPSYLYCVKGLYPIEFWGRWSKEKSLIFDFFETLPSSFILNFSGVAFATNVGEILNVQIGQQKQYVELEKHSNAYSI